MKLVLAALLPLTTASWMLGPRYNPWRGPSLIDTMLDTTLMTPTPSLFLDRPVKQSPKYEITDSEKEIQIVMDVPGVDANNIEVNVQDGILSVSGHREAKDENSSFSYKFSQSFSLPEVVETDHVEADLKNGVLTVTAPKNLKRLEANVRKIPITAAAPEEKPMIKQAAAEEEHKEPVATS